MPFTAPSPEREAEIATAAVELLSRVIEAGLAPENKVRTEAFIGNLLASLIPLTGQHNTAQDVDAAFECRDRVQAIILHHFTISA